MNHITSYLPIGDITYVRKIIDIPMSDIPNYLIALQSALHLMEKQYEDLVKNTSDHIQKEHKARYQNLKELFNSLWQDKNL